jgi:hypothetical protein
MYKIQFYFLITPYVESMSAEIACNQELTKYMKEKFLNECMELILQANNKVHNDYNI